MLADLSRYPLAEMIRRLSAAQLSGDLEVRDGRVAKTVYFDRGRVVFAASNVDADRLGDMLVSIGRISQADYDKVSRMMKAGPKPLRFGDALLVAGLMDRNELGRSLARQVRSIVRSLFALESGAASFAERKSTIPVEYMVGVSVHRMLYAGIRSMSNARLLRAGVGRLDRRVRRSEAPPFRFAVYKCLQDELDILDRCRTPSTIRELVADQGRLSPGRLKTVYALDASGVLEDAEPDQAKRPRPVPHPETGTFLLTVAEQTPPSRAEAVRLEVTQELEFSEHLDAGAWARASDPAAVVHALEEKIGRLCRLHEGVGEDADLKRDLEIVLGRTTTAWHRARQLRSARPATPPGARAPEFPTPAPPPASSAVPSPALEPAIALPAPSESPAGDVSGPGAPGGGDSAATLPPSTRPAPAVAPAARSAPAAHTPPPASDETPPRGTPTETAVAPEERKQRQLLATAELRLKVRDAGGAVEAYRELVALAPDVQDYRLRLARAMMGWAPTLRQAEREFLEVVRLAPGNAQAHYEFALFYEKLRFRGRALAELRTALQADPAHHDARALLTRLSPREAATNPVAGRNR